MLAAQFTNWIVEAVGLVIGRNCIKDVTNIKTKKNNSLRPLWFGRNCIKDVSTNIKTKKN